MALKDIVCLIETQLVYESMKENLFTYIYSYKQRRRNRGLGRLCPPPHFYPFSPNEEHVIIYKRLCRIAVH